MLCHVCRSSVLPDRLLTPWAKFLSGLQRRFCVRQAVGDPVAPDVGYPEGDPLSTVAMSMSDVIFHGYLQVLKPAARSHSFVDNLAVTAESACVLAKSFQQNLHAGGQYGIATRVASASAPQSRACP